MESFRRCSADTEALRSRFGLAEVSYHASMDEAQIDGLVAFLKEAGVSPNNLLTYKNMHLMSQVLCRWPRPRELAEASRKMYAASRGKSGGLPVYYVTYFFLDAVDDADAKEIDSRLGAFVGREGRNLSELTEKNNVMYMWVKKVSGSQTRVLYVYSRNALGEERKRAIRRDIDRADLEVSGISASVPIELTPGGSEENFGDADSSGDVQDQEGGGASRRPTAPAKTAKTPAKTTKASVKTAKASAKTAKTAKTAVKTAKTAK